MEITQDMCEVLEPEALQFLVDPGENLITPYPHDLCDLRDVYGYESYPVLTPQGEAGSSVLLAVEPGGAVEPVTIVNPIALTVRAMAGRGTLFVYYKDEEKAHVYELEEGDSKVVNLGPTATYAYKNTGTRHFVVRDDACPPFNDGDEISLLSDPNTELPHSFLLQFSDDPYIQAELGKLSLEN